MARTQLQTFRRGTTPRLIRRRGVAATEFAIVAPIFFLLIIGVIEVGRAIMVQQVLINAARAGARRAVMLSSTQQETLDAVTDFTDSVGVPTVTASVTPDPGAAAAGTAITVSASVNFASVSWLPAPWFMGSKVLSSTSVMRKEGF
jgi:Flp pilus assembly protein TadG